MNAAKFAVNSKLIVVHGFYATVSRSPDGEWSSWWQTGQVIDWKKGKSFFYENLRFHSRIFYFNSIFWMFSNGIAVLVSLY